MTRLDAFIQRMQAQRACIDHVANHLDGLNGPVLELGLGNGRTYDHLRHRFPSQPIYVFERQVAAHPDCIPPDELLRLGDFRTSLPAFLAEGLPAASFVHADIGSGDKQKSLQLAADLAPTIHRLLAPRGYLGCDQEIHFDGLEPYPMPDEGFAVGRYHMYRRAA